MIPGFSHLPIQTRYELINLVTKLGQDPDAAMQAFGVCRNTVKSALAWHEVPQPLGHPGGLPLLQSVDSDDKWTCCWDAPAPDPSD
jgi:hypothetical protein